MYSTLAIAGAKIDIRIRARNTILAIVIATLARAKTNNFFSAITFESVEMLFINSVFAYTWVEDYQQNIGHETTENGCHSYENQRGGNHVGIKTLQTLKY